MICCLDDLEGGRSEQRGMSEEKEGTEKEATKSTNFWRKAKIGPVHEIPLREQEAWC